MPTTLSLRPRFREEDAVALARDLYGLSASARPLPSERDQNFHLTTPSGEAFVLKIARATEQAEELALQNDALGWLAARNASIPLPRVHPTVSGSAVTAAQGPNGATHLVRLLSYLPGVVFARANPQTPALLRSLGRYVGTLDRALQGFSHPAAVDRDLDWDPKRAPRVIAAYKDAVADPARRAIVEHFVSLYEREVPPLLPSLRSSVIHNDVNDYNVLVSEPGPGEREVVGLVDFGDMVHAWTVCDLAVAIAYATLGKPDPAGAAAHVVAGYHEAFPLEAPEIEALFALACIRLATSVCLSAHRARAEPGDDYLMISEAPAWKALEKLRDVHPRFAHYVFREACGLPPCPRSVEVVSWLSDDKASVGPLLAFDVSKALVLDLSVGSPLFETPAEAADMRALERRLLGLMSEAGAEVAIGRYDEARLYYTSEAYKGPVGEQQEWRTVHLGADLFAPPGSPVFAPLPGNVHSFRINAARLDYGPTIILEHAPPGGPRFFTLYGHLSEDSLTGLREGAPVARGQAIGRIGSPPGNGDWPPHLHFQLVTDLLDRQGDFPGVAPASQRPVWLSLSPDPGLVLGVPAERLAGRSQDPAALLGQRRARLGPSLSLSYRRPLTIVRGFGSFLYDDTGRAYLDVVNNVAHVGHCHPQVVRAGARQMTVLNTNTRYLHDAILRYAERLTATLPEPLRVCFFVSSGSEANELALRLARAHTKGRHLVVLDGAYHGNTAGLIEISPYKFDGQGGEGPPPHVHKVAMPDDYRGPYRRGDPRCGEKYAAHVREALDEVRGQGGKPAAVICESLLSCGGQIVLPPGYLQAAYRYARDAGSLCIADEVQVGFGRVGTHFWGFETQGVVPDIVTLGKPIGNGHPLGAVITTREIAASFANGMEYFNTFGGNPVSCAVGLAVLDVIRDEQLQERALRVGGHFKAGLESLLGRHPILGDVRGLGLFLGIELVLDREARRPAGAQAGYVVERMKDHGILLSSDGPDENIVKIKPPLVFSEADADRVVATLDNVLREDFVRLE